MGHERIGSLPRSKQWRDIVAEIAEHSREKPKANEIAKKTLSLAREKLGLVGSDQALAAAFRFLVLFSASTQAEVDESTKRLLDYMGTATTDAPLAVGTALKRWISTEAVAGSEHVELATRSAATALAEWFDAHDTGQQDLFPSGKPNTNVWQSLSTGAAFSELARLFFKEVVRTSLHYLLDRESSGVLRSIDDATSLSDGLDRYAFETAKITQSFSAGWYNKHAVRRSPTVAEIDGFVRYSVHKLRDELLREAKPAS
jgi:hypothetical protein